MVRGLVTFDISTSRLACPHDLIHDIRQIKRIVRGTHLPWQFCTAAVGVAALMVLAACNGGGSNAMPPVQGPPPPPPPPPTAQTQFADATASSGIDYVNELTAWPALPDVAIAAPSAVATGDYDNDGDIDILIVRGDAAANLLYRNIGNLVFEEVAMAAGIGNTKSAGENYYHSGAMFADLLVLPALYIMLTRKRISPTDTAR